jgi:hypothetical protein
MYCCYSVNSRETSDTNSVPLVEKACALELIRLQEWQKVAYLGNGNSGETSDTNSVPVVEKACVLALKTLRE